MNVSLLGASPWDASLTYICALVVPVAWWMTGTCWTINTPLESVRPDAGQFFSQSVCTRWLHVECWLWKAEYLPEEDTKAASNHRINPGISNAGGANVQCSYRPSVDQRPQICAAKLQRSWVMWHVTHKTFSPACLWCCSSSYIVSASLQCNGSRWDFSVAQRKNSALSLKGCVISRDSYLYKQMFNRSGSACSCCCASNICMKFLLAGRLQTWLLCHVQCVNRRQCWLY